MNRHEFLRGLHRVTATRNYLEIGVNDGRSLTLSQVPSIGIDPAFKVNVELRADIHLVKATSDDFFATKDPLGHLKSARNPVKNARKGRPLFAHYRGGTTLDLAFIDGMHLFEYALRDFMNVERFSRWDSVIVLDDMLPRDIDEAARDRHTDAWTGDVYKLIPVLAKYRPELTVVPVDTEPTGVLLILGADPGSTVLKDHYDEIVQEWVVPDPQKVPEGILSRVDAVSPEMLLRGGFWTDLVRNRNRRAARTRYDALRGQVNAALGRS
ncbi:class I SAM-dependent methyltransferase [Actinacidiphila yeochonensis]|uniref:class I SAM-dependent methyltransferase n=1 Tax=Actinacidiphila yeochonensis TaxID=89050 RepID=UPI00055A2ACE|nr:class I SAM-dependent methyltransferase [Actinacidiphila yeochonensis]